eukprot:7359338-Karenia_brevis.AAC.1
MSAGHGELERRSTKSKRDSFLMPSMIPSASGNFCDLHNSPRSVKSNVVTIGEPNVGNQFRCARSVPCGPSSKE